MLETLPGRYGRYRDVLARCDCGTTRKKSKEDLRRSKAPTCRECWARNTQGRFKRAEATREERAAFHASIGQKRPSRRSPDKAGQLPLLVNGIGRVCQLHGIPMKMRLENRINKYRRKDGGVTPSFVKDRARWECPLCETMRRPKFQESIQRILSGDMPTGFRLSKHQRAVLPADVVAKYDQEMEARREERRRATNERNRARRYAEKYGLSVEQVEQKAEAQEGACAICHRTDRPLVVDHCHGTGLVRDLLCGNCNTGLGMFEDSQLLFLRAMLYVKRHRSAS